MIKQNRSAFTLAEMMIVMLILTILLAAFAPLMTRKAKVDLSNPWRWANNNSDIYYGIGTNQTAMIGQNNKAAADPNAKLLINSGNNPALTLKNNNEYLSLYFAKHTPVRDLDDGWVSKALCMSGTDSSNFNCGLGSTSYGYNALTHNTTGIQNLAFGEYALEKNTTGSGNIAIGSETLNWNTEGKHNIAIGLDAMLGNTDGNRNIAIGNYAKLYDTTSLSFPDLPPNDNIVIGYKTNTSSGSNNVVIGNEAKILSNFSGDSLGNNVLIGRKTNAFYNNSTIIGTEAGPRNGDLVHSYAPVTALGYKACSGWQPSFPIDYFKYNTWTGSYTCIGAYSGPGVTIPESYSTGQIYLGTSQDVVIAGNILYAKYLYSEGNVIQTSDKRLKDIIGESKFGLSEIRKLKVYNYTMKEDKGKTKHMGIIAQDLQKIIPNAITKNSSKYLAVKTEYITYSMLNAIKELDKMLQDLAAQVKTVVAQVAEHDTQIKALQKENKELKTKVQTLEKQNKSFEARLKAIEKKL